MMNTSSWSAIFCLCTTYFTWFPCCQCETPLSPNNIVWHCASDTHSCEVLLILTPQKVKLHFTSIQIVVEHLLPVSYCAFNKKKRLWKVFWCSISIHPFENIKLRCCHGNFYNVQKSPLDMYTRKNLFWALSVSLRSLILFDFQQRSMWDITPHPVKCADFSILGCLICSLSAQMSETALHPLLDNMFHVYLQLHLCLAHGK